MDRKEEIFKSGILLKYEIPNDIMSKLDPGLLTKNKEYAFSYMLPKDTIQILEQKRNYGFYINSLLNDFNRVRAFNGRKHSKQFVGVSEKLSEIITSLHLSWADLISYYSDIYDSSKK